MELIKTLKLLKNVHLLRPENNMNNYDKRSWHDFNMENIWLSSVRRIFSASIHRWYSVNCRVNVIVPSSWFYVNWMSKSGWVDSINFYWLEMAAPFFAKMHIELRKTKIYPIIILFRFLLRMRFGSNGFLRSDIINIWTDCMTFRVERFSVFSLFHIQMNRNEINGAVRTNNS